MKKGWPIKTLGDVCQLISGQHIDAKDYNTESRGVGYLTGPSDFGPLHPVITKWTEHPKIKAKRGDVLITVKGSGVGKINLLDDDEVAISRQLMAVRATGAEPSFVHAILSSTFDHFQSLSTGAAIPGISREQVLGLTIALPPLAEQQRIVGLLDEAFAGLANAKANAEKNLQNTRALFPSILTAALHSDAKKWASRELESLLLEGRKISYGIVKPGLHDPEGVRLIKSQQVRDDTMDLSADFRITKELDEEYARTRLQGGEILLNLVGASIGRSAIAPKELRGANVSRAIAVIPVRHELASWIQYNLRGSVGQELIQSKTGGSAQPVLNLSEVKTLTIPFPPLAEQQTIVEELDALSEETQRLARLYERKHAALEALKKSLLHQAFTGQL